MKILLVDDDTEIAQLISRRLKRDNYVVEVATDGECAIELLQLSPYSLVLLDLMLPKLSGIEVCQTLRNQGNHTPVMMLTGQDHTKDKIIGLDAGADDYLVKPFELDELTARVRALLRRNSDMATAVISYGPLQFDPRTQILTHLEKPLSLRPKELAILELMLRYPTQIFEPNSILDQLWDLADCPGKATVKSHIRSLRKQLEAVGAHDVIETIYGRGYRLHPALLETGGTKAGGTKAGGKEGDNTPHPAARSDSALAVSSQAIVDQTWEQVQSMSWHRLCRLETLVQSYAPSEPDDFPQKTQLVGWTENCNMAIAISHQLKGTLGTFGFQTASLQAKHVEELLTASALTETVNIALIQAQVSALHQQLQQHMTQGQNLAPASSPVEKGLPSLDTTRILVASHDDRWAQALSQKGQDGPFHIQVCSPLTINDYLLVNPPSVILLEISKAKRAMDLSLLDALVSNYGEQVPILTVLESQNPDEQLVAIHHGARAIAQKNWSVKTLLTIIAEFARPEIKAQS